MRASRFSTILLFTTAWATAGPLVAQEGGREDSSLRATVTLPSTESRVVHSEVLDRDLRVYVAFPPGYGTGATYPVLYALDANWSFAMLTQASRLLWLGRQLPGFLIVGIGYPTDDDVEVTLLRTRDYTPTRDTAYEARLAERLGSRLRG